MLKVRIARNWEDKERGLGGVRELPDNEGMLFEFDRPQRLSFWGKETYIPLDIAFVTGDIITKIASIHPHDLRTISSDLPATCAIEANAGFFARMGIRAGDRIDITDRLRARVSAYLQHELDADHCIIRFVRNGHIIEGHSHVSQKEIVSLSSNFKLGQIAAPQEPPKVEKRHMPSVGQPIGQPAPEQVDTANLPVLDISDLGSMLEDSYDEEPQDVGQTGQEQPAPEEQEAPQEPQEEQYPTFSNPFEASQWAQQNNEVMRISYTTAHGRHMTRDVEPHGSFHSKSTHRQILVTFDETVGDVRAFIITNIGAWAFTGRQFQKKFIVRG